MDNRKVNVSINGTNYLVEIDDLSTDVVQVRVNGKPYEARVMPVEKGPSPSTSRASSSAGLQEISKAVIRSNAQSGSNDAVDSEVRAPMPGTILNVSVKVGEAVTRGQQLCALEAMKMKSAIRSPREGVINCVEVVEGMKVAYHDLLFRFERA